MRLDSMTAEIRPRSDWEAVDLGLALARRDFWRCWTVWWLALAVPTVLVGWWLWDAPMWGLVLFWWWKPAGSRLVLFELSRRLFGERPTWRESLRQIPPAWTRRFFYRLVWARLSPWLPVLLAVEDLERLAGTAYQQRRRQVTRRGEAVVVWLYVISDMAACGFGLAIFLLVRELIPDGQDGAWRLAIESWDAHDPASLPLWFVRVFIGGVMVAMSLTDVFITGAGFGIYLNNRTWLEGWDVELAFKRLTRRITKVAVWAVVWGGMVLAGMTGAAPERDPGRWVREVKADAAFKVHTVIERVPDSSAHSGSWEWPEWLTFGGAAHHMESWVMAAVWMVVIGAILWWSWNARQAGLKRRTSAPTAMAPRVTRGGMGLDLASESLPDDVPGAAWSFWQLGQHQDALGLLYRATISRAITREGVAIQESDTEGDCLRRFDQAGAAVHPGYFRDLTEAWSGLAYAGRTPDEQTMVALCHHWPFSDRRGT